MTRENASLNIAVTFRHTEPTEALKSYATEKITHCLSKFLTGEAEAQVILSVEKRDHTAEAKVKSKVFDVTAKATTADLYAAIDKIVDVLEVQIRKQKEKAKDHYKKLPEDI